MDETKYINFIGLVGFLHMDVFTLRVELKYNYKNMDDKMRFFTKTLKENNGYRSFRKIIKSDKYVPSKVLTYKNFCTLAKEDAKPIDYWLSASIIWWQTKEGDEFWRKIANKLFRHSCYDR